MSSCSHLHPHHVRKSHQIKYSQPLLQPLHPSLHRQRAENILYPIRCNISISLCLLKKEKILPMILHGYNAQVSLPPLQHPHPMTWFSLSRSITRKLYHIIFAFEGCESGWRSSQSRDGTPPNNNN